MIFDKIFNFLRIILNSLLTPIQLLLILIKILFYCGFYLISNAVLGKEDKPRTWNKFINEINEKKNIKIILDDENPLQSFIRLSKKYLNNAF